MGVWQRDCACWKVRKMCEDGESLTVACYHWHWRAVAVVWASLSPSPAPLGVPLLSVGDGDGSEVETEGGLTEGLRMLEGKHRVDVEND